MIKNWHRVHCLLYKEQGSHRGGSQKRPKKRPRRSKRTNANGEPVTRKEKKRKSEKGTRTLGAILPRTGNKGKRRQKI